MAKRVNVTKFRLCLLAAAALATAGLAAGAERREPVPAAGGEVFAVVGKTVITGEEYDNAFHQAARQKFYHRKPPQGEVAALQREVGDRLIHRVLLLAEARRRGLKPDPEKVRKTVAEYDARYGDSEQWRRNRAEALPRLVQQLEQQDVLERLEGAIRSGPAATAEQARAYYDGHRDLFTEPEKVKLSAILLKVDPASAQAVWDQAHEQALQLVRRLKAGADFAALARQYSAENSARNGGDLGYLHRGMLQKPLQEVVDRLEPGAISEPVVVLEGVAIVRLAARQPAALRAYADVQERAATLWERERAGKQWNEFLARLRAAAAIRIDESRYPALSADGKSGHRSRQPAAGASVVLGERGA